MAVEAARDDADEEPLHHSVGRPAEHAEEVEDVFDDGEAQSADRPVHEPVHRAVRLVAGDEEDEHDAESLQRLLDEGRRERGGPSRREGRPAELRDHEPPTGVREGRELGRRDGAPDERCQHERQRLALVQVQEVDDEEHRQRVQQEQPPREEPPRGRDAPVQRLRPDRDHPGCDHDPDVDPERRLLRPHERTRAHEAVGSIGHQATTASFSMAWICPSESWSNSSGAHPS